MEAKSAGFPQGWKNHAGFRQCRKNRIENLREQLANPSSHAEWPIKLCMCVSRVHLPCECGPPWKKKYIQ